MDQYYPELGHGQQELPIRHAPALTAADNQVFYRETVRNVAYSHGLWASLAPKPFPDQAGNGGHIHFSLWDNDGERNVMYDAADQYGLSKLGYHFIAGILDHLPALLALTCPSYNSYRRLQPHFWSSAFTAWGPDNREAAVRVPSKFKSDPSGSTNAELKACDSSSQSVPGAGRAARRGAGRCTPRTVCRAADTGRSRHLQRGRACLLGDQALSHDAERGPGQPGGRRRADGGAGPLLGSSFLAVKRLEWASFSKEDTDFEIKHHFWKF